MRVRSRTVRTPRPTAIGTIRVVRDDRAWRDKKSLSDFGDEDSLPCVRTRSPERLV